MALTRKALSFTDEEQRERERTRGRPPWEPEAIERQLVEVLVSVGASHEAICRELVRRGAPCRHVTTLQRAFPDELKHGKERRMLGYAVKLHSIAMGNGPGAAAVCRFMLAVQGGPEWRVPKDTDAMGDNSLGEGGSGYDDRPVIYIPENRREEAITIEIEEAALELKDDAA